MKTPRQAWGTLALLLLWALLLGGCASSGSQAWIAQLRRDVKPGMPQAQVENVLGAPFSAYASSSPAGKIETWIYLRPQIGTFRLVFDAQGKFVTWYTWFDDVPRIAPTYGNPYSDVADQLRALRMDNSIYRAGQPW